jgi:predicted transcriptional regulator
MQDQPIGPDAARLSNETEFVVLTLLLDPDSPGPWSVSELAREVGCELRAADAVVRLDAAGLVHLSGELVFASRPAVRFGQLIRN